MDQLTIRRVPLDSLHADPSNARLHDDRNVAAITASLARFTQVEPLVVQAGTNRVIAGHGRLLAMRDLGWRECDIVELAVDDLTAASLGIALNRSAELASWDEPTLGKLLRELQSAGAIEGVGFADAEIDELLAGLEDLNTTELADPGPESLPEQPVTRDGDLWVCGSHRIFCADSRDASGYERLLGDEVVDLVWSDPPFGVGYIGKTRDALTIENDDLDLAGLHALLNASFRAANDACRPGAVWYIAAPAGPNFLPFAQVLTDLGIWADARLGERCIRLGALRLPLPT